MRAKLLTTTAIALLFPVTAFAQQGGMTPPPRQGSQPGTADAASREGQGQNIREQVRNRQPQQGEARQAGSGQGPLLLTTWDPVSLYTDGWSARALWRDTTVLGPYGDDIGSVENLILSEDGKVLGIVAEIGGFLDIGDSHVFVPWEQVRISADFNRVTVPITEETVDNYTFADSFIWRNDTQQVRPVDSSLGTGPTIWKVSDVIGDYAYLSDRSGYGYISDIIVSRAGDVQAVVVNPDVRSGTGYRALPWRGYRPYAVGPYYNLGYRRDEVERLADFDLSRIAGGAARSGVRPSAAMGSGSGARGAGDGDSRRQRGGSN